MFNSLTFFSPIGIAYADGGVLLGSTTLLNSGAPASKIDLVFLGDGFTDAEQGAFNTRVDEVVEEFFSAHPFFALRSAFNIHRVNVTSPESGTDRQSTCGGESTGDTDQERQTAMDSSYCGGGTGSTYRCMWSSDTSRAFGFANAAPDDDAILVLVNDTGRGGCAGGGLAFFTLSNDFEEVLIHELGHALFDLADEYDYDGAKHFSGTTEPRRANITIETDRANLKWSNLVVSTTTIPTARKNNCTVRGGAGATLPVDMIGTYEGARYTSCAIFRGEPDCRMKRSNQAFGSVCRRKIIQTLAPFLGTNQAISFERLLIRNDHEPWFKGKGEIYLHYELRTNAEEISWRWPASGNSKFGSGQEKSMDVVAGLLPEPAPGGSAALELRVREADWPDGDDTVRSDATETLPATGSFSIDREEYRLQGTVRPADVRVLLGSLHVKNDHDGFFAGAGDIVLRYIVSNGEHEVKGR